MGEKLSARKIEREGESGNANEVTDKNHYNHKHLHTYANIWKHK